MIVRLQLVQLLLVSVQVNALPCILHVAEEGGIALLIQGPRVYPVENCPLHGLSWR